MALLISIVPDGFRATPNSSRPKFSVFGFLPAATRLDRIRAPGLAVTRHFNFFCPCSTKKRRKLCSVSTVMPSFKLRGNSCRYFSIFSRHDALCHIDLSNL